MEDSLAQQLKNVVKGDVFSDDDTLAHFSHDASIFEVKPKAVVFPRNEADVEAVVRYVAEHKKDDSSLSVTGRAAGTDMGGGPLNESVILAFGKYMNRFISLKDGIATAQPGMYYRNFEEMTLKHDLIFPSYPASREICAIGGIVNNNSGGEKSLEYGKTEKYVKKLKVVFSDGNEYVVGPLSESELKGKMAKKSFEGEVYRKMFRLIEKNYEVIKKAKPTVSKNSAGYFLWNVYDRQTKIFDLTKLIVGAQGTLGIVTEASLKLEPTKRFAEMMIIFLKDLNNLGEVINLILPLAPESLETYDDNTLKLAVKFFSSFEKMLGAKNMIATGWNFLPEFLMMVTGGLPKLILQVEFTSDSRVEINQKIVKLRESLKPYNLKMRVARTKKAERKYWLIRRESFNLLRHKVRDKHTAPFIDDFAVRPEFLPEFLPKLDKIFAKYPHLIYTIAGHLGDGNFHIIPLMNIEDEKQREIIPKLGKEVYDLVLEYKGTITAEHNDGLIRTPYLKHMYGEKIYKLFEETKKIFDPDGIFNPRKKIGGDMQYAMSHIRTSWQ